MRATCIKVRTHKCFGTLTGPALGAFNAQMSLLEDLIEDLGEIKKGNAAHQCRHLSDDRDSKELKVRLADVKRRAEATLQIMDMTAKIV